MIKVTLTGPAKIDGKYRKPGWKGDVSEDIRDQLIKADCLPKPVEVPVEVEELSIVDVLHKMVFEGKNPGGPLTVKQVAAVLGRKLKRAELDEALSEFEASVKPVVQLMTGDEAKSFQDENGAWDADKLAEKLDGDLEEDVFKSAAIIAAENRE